MAALPPLNEVFVNVEQYLREKDSEVDKEVNDMGDENYIPWTDRIRAECAKENEQKLAEKDKMLAEKDDKLAEQDEKIAEQGEKLAEKDEIILELKRQLAALKS
jgi:uncharacterized protein (DUF3084 family)